MDMLATELLRTYQVPDQNVQAFLIKVPQSLTYILTLPIGRLSVSERSFHVSLDHSLAKYGTLRLFARSVKRFEKPVDAGKKETKQLPWCTFCNLFFEAKSV